jgi:hypothetical protein
MDSTIIAAAIGAVATITAASISYFAGKRKSIGSKLAVEKLNNRAAVYERAAQLVKNGKNILDTTWGSDALNLTEAESKALKAYLDAKKLAVSRDNTTYREIFTLTKGEERQQRFGDSKNALAKESNYKAKLLTGLSNDFPMLDFMVVDGEHTILSFLSSDQARPGHRYLYVNSQDIAEHFTEYFDECWRFANNA